MTAVPKPLKFLRAYYPDLTELYTTWTDEDLKVDYNLQHVNLIVARIL